ncbi:MAG TPA: spore coat U domain-containing protein [Rhizomicrobium sp.]
MATRWPDRAFAAAFAAGLIVTTSSDARAAATCDTPGNPVDVSATGLAFGIYSPGAQTPTTSNGTVDVYCAKPKDILPSFTVALSAGGAGNFSPRKMSFGSAQLNYNIYTTPGYTSVWGDGTSGTSMQSYNSGQDQSNVTFTAYGSVPIAQLVTAGSYSDTIMVTVTY